jgi:hypothetical protein
MTGRLSNEAQTYLDQLDTLTKQAAALRMMAAVVEREQQIDRPIAWPDDVAERQKAA